MEKLENEEIKKEKEEIKEVNEEIKEEEQKQGEEQKQEAEQKQEEEKEEVEEKLVDSQVEEALKTDQGREAILESWNTESFTSKGDNYLCTIRRINITFSLANRLEKVSYVAKIKQGVADAFSSFMDTGFEKECLMYGKIVPALNAELREGGMEDLRLPRCYFQSLEKGSEAVIMEDLKSSGFKMACRQKGLDAEHAKLVLRETARLHAASYLYQATLPSNNLALHYPLLQKDWLNYSDKAEGELGVVLKSDIAVLTSVAEIAGRPEPEVAWLRQLSSRLTEVFSQQVASELPFAVLCHGDLWTNNVLFRYGAGGKPEEVRLVDVQLCRRGSVALDLQTLMYSSLSGEIRRANLDTLLHEYYDALTQVLQARRTPVPFTYDQLVAEYRRKGLFGLIIGADYLPVVMVEYKDTPDFDLVSRGEQEFIKSRGENLADTLARYPKLTTAIVDMLQDMTHLGVIGADLSALLMEGK